MATSRQLTLLAWAFLGMLSRVLCQSVTITNVSANGTGCMPGSYVVAIGSAGTAFTISFSKFVGQDSTPTQTCSVVLELSIPAKWRCSKLGLNIRGFSNLASGSTAILKRKSAKIAVSRPGKAPAKTTVQGPAILQTLKGPFNDDYAINTTVSGLCSDAQLHKCHAGVAAVTYDLLATVKGGSSLLTVDSIDGQLTNNILWQYGPECGK